MVDLTDPTFWIPTTISIVAVVLFYLDMRWRIRKDERASNEMAQVLLLMKEELDLFRKQIQQGQLNSQDLLRQRSLQQQNDQAWKNVLGFLKAAKLAKDILSEED